MKFKNYLIIFAAFLVLICSVSTISAVSNDTVDDAVSEINSDDSISVSNDETINANDEEDSNNGDSVLLSNDNSEVYSQVNNSGSDVESPKSDDKLSASSTEISADEVLGASAAKGTVKLSANNAQAKKINYNIFSFSNFVKRGSTYYMYLKDVNGKFIPNKKVNITVNGKTYQRTTDANARFGIKVTLSQSSVVMTIGVGGDNKYNSLSKKLTVYITKISPFTVGNSKLLTKGYLRVYLHGTEKAITNKLVRITIGGKVLSKKTNSEGFVVVKPQVGAKKYTVLVQCKGYSFFKRIACVAGDVKDPLKTAIALVNGIPNIDVMPANYVIGDKDAKYTLTKAQYQEAINRDSKCLYAYGKLSKFTFFKTKASPTINHIAKREKWNVIERTLNTMLVKKNKYEYWPNEVTASLSGKSYTYSEVRDIQNKGYTCGPTSASSCSQALRKYHSEYFFEVEAAVVDGVNIPVLKSAMDNNGYKTSYYYTVSEGLNELKKGGVALVAYLRNHYVSVLDISKDGSKILVSNSYGDYNVGGANKVPTGWVSVKYFKTKFQGVGLVVKANYKLTANEKTTISNFYKSMGPNWARQNTNEKLLNVPI